MEVILVLLGAVLAVYYVAKQIREPGYKVFPFNQVQKYSEQVTCAVNEKNCVADEMATK